MSADETGGQVIPFLIGHRGACGYAPENTLPSLEKAADLGARWIEFDVKLSSDGVPFLMHDQWLERTTDGEGSVGDTAWAELQKLDAGSWFGPPFVGTRLLSLENAIRAMADLRLCANIEIKPCPGREKETAEVVCRAVEAHWPASLPAPLMSSESIDSVLVAQDILTHCDRAVIADGVPDDWRDNLERTGASALHVWHEAVVEADIRPVMDAGYPARAFTVNQRTRALELAECGFSGIFCDFPDRMAGIETKPADAS